MRSVLEIATAAKKASRILATSSTSLKNGALSAMADALITNSDTIEAANRIDMDNGAKNGLTSAMLDRLLTDKKRIESMAAGIAEIIKLPDPVGEINGMAKRPNGLSVGKMRVPLGVVGIIYESRPNVTADTSALCLKSGNAVILRGGSEAFESNRAIAKILADAATGAGIAENAISTIPVTDRQASLEMLKLDRYIDIIIPRGGYGLIRFVTENSLIPVIKHDKGVCHVYVDIDADTDMAESITFNSKVQRPGVCNAMETLLVHAGIAEVFLPGMVEKFVKAGVTVRGCEKTCEILPGGAVEAATLKDWDEEYLDLIVSIKIVEDFDAAVDHIANHGSGHTETIVTDNYRTARRFLSEIDSSAVMVNASTRFNDGGEFGLGAEIGISTQKLHARGPMGLAELTSQKFVVMGDGHIRE